MIKLVVDSDKIRMFCDHWLLTHNPDDYQGISGLTVVTELA